MSFVITTPQFLAAAVADLTDIGDTVRDARRRGGGGTTELGCRPPRTRCRKPSRRCSADTRRNFTRSARNSAEFQQQFVATLGANAGSYAATESANATAVLQTRASGNRQRGEHRERVTPGTLVDRHRHRRVIAHQQRRGDRRRSLGRRGNHAGHGRHRAADTLVGLHQHREQLVPAAESGGDQPAGSEHARAVLPDRQRQATDPVRVGGAGRSDPGQRAAALHLVRYAGRCLRVFTERGHRLAGDEGTGSRGCAEFGCALRADRRSDEPERRDLRTLRRA